MAEIRGFDRERLRRDPGERPPELDAMIREQAVIEAAALPLLDPVEQMANFMKSTASSAARVRAQLEANLKLAKEQFVTLQRERKSTSDAAKKIASLEAELGAPATRP